MFSTARTYDTDAPTTLVAHLDHPAIADGVEDAVDSKNISPAGLLFANRRIETLERPMHSLGQKFIIDRSGDTLAPSDTVFNRPPTAAVLAGIARPELPPRMFGM
jgi:hypothetical protein